MNFKDKIMNECLALLSKEEVKEKDKRYDASITRYDIEGDISLYLHIFDIYNNMFFVSFRDIYIVIKK